MDEQEWMIVGRNIVYVEMDGGWLGGGFLMTVFF